MPEIYRREELALRHEQVSRHLGTTKSKGSVFRCYFWPNCYHDIENYVKNCDPCKKVDSTWDNRNAP